MKKQKELQGVHRNMSDTRQLMADVLAEIEQVLMGGHIEKAVLLTADLRTLLAAWE